MKTSKGSTFTTLLNVKVEQGDLYLHVRVPMDIGDIDAGYIAAMIPHINERISQDKKPGGTYERCLEQIDHHRTHLANAYATLFETYQRTLVPATRTSSADKAKAEMLASIPDMKMLRAMCAIALGDAASNYVLPDDKERLITDTVAAMRAKKDTADE